MTVSQSQSTSAPPRQARHAFRISIAALVICTVYAGYLFTQAAQIGTVERYRAAFMMSGLAVMAALSAWLSRRGRSTLGIIILLGWLYAVVLESPTRQSGQGALLGVIAIMLTVIVASLTLERRWSLRMIGASVVVGIAATLLDTYGPADRPYYELTSLLIVAAICVIGFIVIVAQQFRTYPLRTKLIVAFLLISLVSVGVMALYAERTIRLALQDQVSTHLANVAQLQGTTVGNLLSKEVELLRTLSLDESIRDQAIASNAAYQGTQSSIRESILALDQQWITAANANDDANPLIRSKINNPIADHLREYRQVYPENVEVFVTDRYGALLGATNRTSDYYQADEDWWQSAFNNGQGAIYYSQPVYDRSSNSFSVDIGLPLYDRKGENIVGILRTTVDMASVVALLSTAQSGQTGRADLLLPDNTFLQAGGAKPAPGNLVKDLSKIDGATAEIDLNGVPSFAVGMPVQVADKTFADTIKQLNWHIIAHQASAEILAPVQAQAGALLLVMGLVAVIATGASVGMSQVLVRPIVHLTTVATKVSEGDLTSQAVVETEDEIGVLAATFNSMTAQLRSIVSTLEERVLARTEQLRASADVGRAAASILNTDDLLRNVVNLITDRFGFYYAAVFLVDDEERWAVLRAATGEAGQTLLERHHRLEVSGQSMVGTAIITQRARIALDVGTEAVRFANPLLPETRSEIALPLIVGNRVLGALDVQSKQAAAFDETSAAVLQAMADQIAIALNTANQFAQATSALQQTQALFAVSQALTEAKTAPELLSAVIGYVGAEVNQSALFTYGPRRATGEPEYIESVATWVRPDLVQNIQPLQSGARFSPAQMPIAYLGEPDQPLVVQNSEAEETPLPLRNLMQQFGWAALIVLPLTVGETLLGALSIGYGTARTFTADQLQLLMTLARQMAVALQSQQALAANQAALAQLDKVNRRLIGEAWQEYTETVGGGVRKVKLGADVSPDVALTTLPSMVAAPVVVSGIEIGALRLEDTAADRAWSPTEISVLQAIASEVSVAIEKARLTEQTERRAQQERTINRIAGRIRNSNSIEQMLSIAAQELRTELQATRTVAEIAPAAEPAQDLRPAGTAPDQKRDVL